MSYIFFFFSLKFLLLTKKVEIGICEDRQGKNKPKKKRYNEKECCTKQCNKVCQTVPRRSWCSFQFCEDVMVLCPNNIFHLLRYFLFFLRSSSRQ